MKTETAKDKAEKPVLKIIGSDGNAFAILGAARKAAMRAGWDAAQIEAFMTEAKSGDYDYLLQTCMEYFEVR